MNPEYLSNLQDGDGGQDMDASGGKVVAEVSLTVSRGPDSPFGNLPESMWLLCGYLPQIYVATMWLPTTYPHCHTSPA